MPTTIFNRQGMPMVYYWPEGRELLTEKALDALPQYCYMRLLGVKDTELWEIVKGNVGAVDSLLHQGYWEVVHSPYLPNYDNENYLLPNPVYWYLKNKESDDGAGGVAVREP